MNDLKKDVIFVHNDTPCKVLEVRHKKMARQGASAEVKFRNLATGAVITQVFFPSHKFEQGEVEKIPVQFVYAHRGQYCFMKTSDKKRIMLTEDQVAEKKKYFVVDLKAEALYYKEKLIDLALPIKVDARVIEAPPNIKGNSASSTTKTVTIETEAQIQTPLFINTGDTIRVNTQTGEYVERVTLA